MSHTKLSFTAGFAIFSMFFGSGNLVFPILVRTLTGTQFLNASLGLLVTSVLIPFLGLMAMMYAHGNRALFFNKLPPQGVLILTFAMLALMGPLGVIPRCVIVSQGSIHPLLPDLPPALFNAIFIALTGICAWHKEKIIRLIGVFLTPWLLLGIFIMIILGLTSGPLPQPSLLSSYEAFIIGLTQGYQTMDLLAAFFFSATTIGFIASNLKTHEDREKLSQITVTACLIGALLLTGVYISFVLLGAEFSQSLDTIPGEQLLIVIATHVLGPLALPLSSAVIFLACLTTATILTTLFSDFVVEDMLKGTNQRQKNLQGPSAIMHRFQEKTKRHFMVIITLGISFGLSLFGFTSLAKWIQYALMIFYPALIAYTILFLLEIKTSLKFTRAGFYITLGATIFIRILNITT